MTEAPEKETEAPGKDARMWATICHLSGLAGLTVIPLVGLIAPLVIWLIKREDDPFIDDQGKEAVNFQITVAIAILASVPLWLICIGYVLTIAVWIADIVFCIIAAVKANTGLWYRYPLAIRLIK